MVVWILLSMLGARWGLPNDHSWSNDNPFPQFALELPALREGGTHKYPYLQAVIDRALYAPALRAWSGSGRYDPACPPGELECFADPVEQVGALLAISRLRSMVLGLGLVLAGGWLGFRLYGDPLAARMTAMLLLFSETLVFYAHLGNLDVPMGFWFVLSMVAFERVLRRGRWYDDLALGLLAALALATKDGIVGAYVLIALVLIAAHLRGRGGFEEEEGPGAGGPAAWGGGAWRRVLLVAGALLIPYAWIMNVAGNPAGYLAHIEHWIGGEGISGYNQRFSGWMAFGALVLQRARESVGWPAYLFLLAGMAYGLKRRPRSTLIVAVPVASYLLFTLLPIRFVYARFLLPMLPLFAAPAGLLAADLWRVEGRRGIAARGLVLLVAAYSLLYTLAVLLGMRSDTRISAEAWLRAHVPTDRVVHGLGSEYALPRLEMLGYAEHDRFDWEELEPGYPDSLTPEYIVLTSKSFRGARGWRSTLRDDLLAERLGYRVVFDEESRAWLERHLPGAVMEARVSPRIVVLEREDGAERHDRRSDGP